MGMLDPPFRLTGVLFPAKRVNRIFFNTLPSRVASKPMCRSIRTLHNYDPLATDEEVRAAALQFVRKISGSTRPSRLNQEVFEKAVEAIPRETRSLVDGLVTRAPPKNREEEAAKARARADARYGQRP